MRPSKEVGRVGQWLTWMVLTLLIGSSPGVAASASSRSAQYALQKHITEIGRSFDGDIGIAVKDVQSNYLAQFDGNTYFPQQSVSKLWGALAALSKVDAGALNLSSTVQLSRSDRTLFHQPIAALIPENGSYRTTVSRLMLRAIQQSDNTANDAVLRKIGGPAAVRTFLRAAGLVGIRFGPGERLMQSRLAGLEWHQRYSVGRAFYTARAEVPMRARRAAFDAYIANPPDGAKPVAVVSALQLLKRGELLSNDSAARILDIMSRTRTGPNRLKGGLPSGWRIAHKTGTGQQLGNTQTGYNDIGIITSPRGRSYAVAVMIRRTSAPVWSRMRAMQQVSRAVVRYDAAQPRR